MNDLEPRAHEGRLRALPRFFVVKGHCRTPRIPFHGLAAPLPDETRRGTKEGESDAFFSLQRMHEEAPHAVRGRVIAEVELTIDREVPKLRNRRSRNELHEAHDHLVFDREEGSSARFVRPNRGLELRPVLLGTVGTPIEPLVLVSLEMPVTAEARARCGFEERS